MNPYCLTVVLALLSVGLASGQTDEAAKGLSCYSCDYTKDGEACLYEPYSQATDTCASPDSRCYFTYYPGQNGEGRYGRRGCTENMDSLPFGLNVDKIEGCHTERGYTLCHVSCGYDYCNYPTPKELTIASSASVLLPALWASAGIVTGMMLIRQMLL